jgi:hypothetical protein
MTERQARAKILVLLEYHSRSTNVTFEHLLRGLENRPVVETPYGPYPEPTSAVAKSIQDTRNIYKNLSRQIHAVPVRSSGKRTALNALAAFDTALVYFHKGLVTADSPGALEELRNASGFFKQAHAGLLRAKQELR